MHNAFEDKLMTTCVYSHPWSGASKHLSHKTFAMDMMRNLRKGWAHRTFHVFHGLENDKRLLCAACLFKRPHYLPF